MVWCDDCKAHVLIILKFFCETVEGKIDMVYEIDGQLLMKKHYPVAIIATNAQASLASKGKYRKDCVELFWNTPLRKGDRCYDNCLYMFALLALSGNFKI